MNPIIWIFIYWVEKEDNNLSNLEEHYKHISFCKMKIVQLPILIY